MTPSNIDNGNKNEYTKKTGLTSAETSSPTQETNIKALNIIKTAELAKENTPLGALKIVLNASQEIAYDIEAPNSTKELENLLTSRDPDILSKKSLAEAMSNLSNAKQLLKKDGTNKEIMKKQGFELDLETFNPLAQNIKKHPVSLFFRHGTQKNTKTAEDNLKDLKKQKWFDERFSADKLVKLLADVDQKDSLDLSKDLPMIISRAAQIKELESKTGKTVLLITNSTNGRAFMVNQALSFLLDKAYYTTDDYSCPSVDLEKLKNSTNKIVELGRETGKTPEAIRTNDNKEGLDVVFKNGTQQRVEDSAKKRKILAEWCFENNYIPYITGHTQDNPVPDNFAELSSEKKQPYVRFATLGGAAEFFPKDGKKEVKPIGTLAKASQ